MERAIPERGVIGSQAAIDRIKSRLPDGTPVIISGYVPKDQVYILRDKALAAYLELLGIGVRT